MSSPEKKGAQQTIKCSFCDQEKSSAEIGEHLLQCGNKTEQCPNCRKFIRRAVFTYHYENNCANLDEIDDENNRPTVVNHNTSTTLKIPSPKQERQISTIHVDLSQHSVLTSTEATTQPIPVKTIYVCDYCRADCDIKDMQKHKDNCLENPKNQKKEQVPAIQRLAQQNPIIDQPTNNETVLCELCRKQIRLQHFDAHEVGCTERELKQAREEGRLTVIERQQNDLHRCRYCSRVGNAAEIRFHERMCGRDPNYTNDSHYRSAYRPLRPFGTRDDELY